MARAGLSRHRLEGVLEPALRRAPRLPVRPGRRRARAGGGKQRPRRRHAAGLARRVPERVRLRRGAGSPVRAPDPDRPRPAAAGLSRVMLEHMRGLAHARGWELVAPVRPTLKQRYPLTPIERYVEWRREDGLHFDPWLRAHERLGAELVSVARDSMVVEGTVGELEEWCGLEFPESGSYVVEGALVPVEIDRERDRGTYREPNVWMRHPAG